MPNHTDSEELNWTLTPRQQEVLDYIAKGFSNPEIARLLNISLGTVKSHVAAIIQELDVSNRLEAAVLYKEFLNNQQSQAPTTVSATQHTSEANTSPLKQPPNQFPSDSTAPQLHKSDEPYIKLAVMPFLDLSQEQNYEYFGDGLADSLITALAKQEGLKVLGRTSTFALKNSAFDVPQIGSQLGVSGIVEGSIRIDKNSIRVNVQLVETASGTTLWGDSFHRHLDEVFEIQEAICCTLAKVLSVKVSSQSLSSNPPPTQPARLDAYRLYWQGRYFWNQRTPHGVLSAIELFDKTIQQDSNFALAYVGLADAYNQVGAYATFPPADMFPKAKSYAQAAIDLDPTCGEAYASLGYAKLFYDWDLDGAEELFSKAIELNPGYAFTHGWQSFLSIVRGQREQAVAQALQGKSLDPLSVPFIVHLGHIYRCCYQYNVSLQHLDDALLMEPKNSRALNWKALTLGERQQFDAAIEMALESVEVAQRHPITLATLGFVYGKANKLSEARAILQDLENLSSQQYVSPFYMAMVTLGLCEIDKAFKFLHQAADERSPLLVMLFSDPIFDVIREEPPFEELSSRVLSFRTTS